MKRISFLLIVILMAGIQVTANAAGKKKQSLHDQMSSGYGLAGCGLGSMIFGAKPGMVQVIAATTNGFYSNQTFGITSGTSNCDIPQMGLEAATYIEINKETLKKDAARGQGETLEDLAGILKCENQLEFDSILQKNYSDIFMKSDDSFNSTRELLKLIETNSSVNCQLS